MAANAVQEAQASDQKEKDMDRKTRDERRRMKQQRTTRNTLSEFESRGMAAKNKIQTFPAQRCTHRDGAKEVMVRRTRKDGTSYALKLEIGGIRCIKTAIAGKTCLEHLG
jgi:hypothetical protein